MGFKGDGIVNCRVPTSILKQWCGQIDGKFTKNTVWSQEYGRHVTFYWAAQYKQEWGPEEIVSGAHTDYKDNFNELQMDGFDLEIEMRRREKKAYDRGFDRGMRLMIKYG